MVHSQSFKTEDELEPVVSDRPEATCQAHPGLVKCWKTTS